MSRTNVSAPQGYPGDVLGPLQRLSPKSIRRRSPKPKVISMPKQSLKSIDPKLYPEGACRDCQKITLHGLLSTSRESAESDAFWVDYGKPPGDCPMCNIIFRSIRHGGELKRPVRIGFIVDDKKAEGDMLVGRQVREVRVRKCVGGNAYVASSGEFRIYAEPGT